MNKEMLKLQAFYLAGITLTYFVSLIDGQTDEQIVIFTVVNWLTIFVLNTVMVLFGNES